MCYSALCFAWFTKNNVYFVHAKGEGLKMCTRTGLQGCVGHFPASTSGFQL